jgi:hypothetical protein
MNVGHGCTTPRYVRAINIKNSSGLPLNITTTHKSGVTHAVNSSEGNFRIEQDIDHGTWKSVDPITKIQVEANGEVKEVEFPEDTLTGVEIFDYHVMLNDNKISFTKEN